MPVAPSFTDLLGQFEAEALAQRPTLQFNDGDVSEAQQHGAGAMADAAIRYAAQAFKNTFIDGAEGDTLAALVNDHLNLQKSPATPAQVDVTFARPAATAGAGSLGAGFTVGTVVDASGNTITYTLNSPVGFGIGDLGPHTATATATTLGRVTNAAAGTVTRMIDTAFDTSITVTNAAAAGGGNDEESDLDLRVRARTFWVALRRGTLAALEFGALEIPSVRVVHATEDLSTGLVTVVVSDSDGNSTAQMISDVETELENWRAAGSIVTVLGGTQLLVPLVGTMVFRDRSGADPNVYGPLVAAAMASRMAKLRQGEVGYLDAIKAAGIAVDPDVIEAILLSSPIADITPTASQTVRAGTITLT